ncbi:MAG TPA: helix-turn-helix transcriptional regulator [Vicinamibacterales bacterium]|nr:helix-turn-helix transcriptional regulator [Vicinamibacterales bacterium]
MTRLRRHRQRNQISLDEIASETRVKRELLEALENNDLSEWPRGLYARAWVRAYASTVGLDPIDTVDEFCRLFPHGDRRARGTITEIAAIVAAPPEYRDEIAHEDRRRNTTSGSEEPPAQPELPPPSWHAPVTNVARAIWVRLTSPATAQNRRTLPSR